MYKCRVVFLLCLLKHWFKKIVNTKHNVRVSWFILFIFSFVAVSKQRAMMKMYWVRCTVLQTFIYLALELLLWSLN